MKKVIFPQILLLLAACEQQQATPKVAPEPWPNEAEVVFQQAAVLRYEVEERKAEAARLKAQGLDGAPPMPRREKATTNMANANNTTGQSRQRE